MKFLFPLLLSFFLISCSGTPGGNKSGNGSLIDSVNADKSKADSISRTTSSRPDSAGIEFGFCNTDGKEMLLLAESLSDPSKFSNVISADREIAAIAYAGEQKSTTEDNGRQNEFNFKNCKGYLFEAKSKTATPEHSVVFMSNDFVAARKYYAINPPAKKELPSAIKSRLEKEKARKIKDYRCLTLLGKDSSIYIVEFENIGDSALASLAFITPGKIIYEDFPATWNDMSTWRVDDGGSFGVEYFDLLAVFEKDGKLEIITDWPGAEGIATEYLKEKDGAFKSIKGISRYSAPL